jgi:hypothetical protein
VSTILRRLELVGSWRALRGGHDLLGQSCRDRTSICGRNNVHSENRPAGFSLFSKDSTVSYVTA